MLSLPALPPTIKPLKNDEYERLHARFPSMPAKPGGKHCITCRGALKFTWLDESGVPADYECDCIGQWALYHYFQNANIGLTYQRLRWADMTATEQGALDKVQTYLEKADAYVRSGVGLILYGEMGCIQGDAQISVNRAGKGFSLPLRDLVHRFNGGKAGGWLWREDIPTYVQREAEDGTIRLARLSNAWHSGEKTTYTVTTDAGRTVRATDQHPFLTEAGWKRLDELQPGDQVHIRGEQRSGRSRQPKVHYRQMYGMDLHPYSSRCANKKAVPYHRLVAEAEINGMDVDRYATRVAAGVLEGLTLLDPAVYAVHHRDHDAKNNDLSNLQVLTHEEHHALHAAEGKTASVLYKVTTERVVSVIEFGVEPTYDLEVADDPHNFIANGFVVHNTGKTALSSLLLKSLMAAGYDGYFTTFSEMIDTYTGGWNDKEERAWFHKRIKNAGILVLDDVGKEFQGRAKSGLPESTFDEVLRHRVAASTPTIITTNHSLKSLQEGYGGNVMSLLHERSSTYQFTGEDFRENQTRQVLAEANGDLTRPVTVG